MGANNPQSPSLLFLLCLCFSMFSTHVPRASSLSFNLNFSDPSSVCGLQINCTGDASVNQELGMLELTTNDVDSTIDSIGRAIYAKPVPLWDATGGAKLLASFTTSFTFRITPVQNTGDGMAFFLTPYLLATEIPPQSFGGGLGLLAGGNWIRDSWLRFVAVEFDTWNNGLPTDISGNHMGIDNTSIVSMASVDTSSPTGNLTSGLVMTATINYHNGSKLLTADLQINGSSYHVNATIDLSTCLPEEVAVGFSAATGLSAELHRVLAWSFSSTLPSKDTGTSSTLPSKDTGTTTATSKLPKKLRILLSILLPVLFLSVCAAVGTYFLVRRRRKASDYSSSDSEEQSGRAELERGVAAGGPRRYTYRELVTTTNNFADDNKLGRGGFGSVYLGQLTVAGGQERAVAIKMLSSESSAQGRKEFEAEVRIISRLKHRNLVQLLGWCDSRNGLMLVYELVAQGSLDRHLYSRDRFLTWPQRYQIILGLGSALRYLHNEWEQCVVHGDIKPSNIMLDESHGTKLGDFGLARLVDHGAGWKTTKAVLGTAGYIDPEFVNTRCPSTHSDVYSFGIVLLETVCNRAPVSMKEGEEPFLLLKWVWGLYGRNATLDAADERLRGNELDEQVMERVLVVGLWCAHPDPSERPSIEQAMHVLQSEDKSLLPALSSQMYKTVLNVPVPGRAYGALCIDAYSGISSSATTGTNTNLSSDPSPTPLL